MGAPFQPWTNTAIRLALLCLAGTLLGAPFLLMAWVRTPWVTNEDIPVSQPVAFDHRHHVNDDGIDCRYCHMTAETDAVAGIPTAAVCMGCHGQIWNASPLLAPVRASYFSGTPISWNRVNALPDFVYFNHSAHLTKGVGCATCHGRVDQMPQVAKGAPLTMQWCLDCHRDPGPHLRPGDAITRMDWKPTDAAAHSALERQMDAHPKTYCSSCHR